MRFETNGEPLELDIVHLVIAGFTGRDQTANRHHAEELAALGVAPPSTMPIYYRVSASLLSTTARIQVVGGESSGEVEPLIVQHGGRRWLGLGSDHTDRALESHSVAMSKQACPKPCAAELWPWEDVADRLDELRLESWIEENGAWTPYQQGGLDAVRPLTELIEGAELDRLAGDGGVAMMCGTLGAKGGVRPAARFRMELSDPSSGRRIRHEYVANTLPEIA